MTDALSPAGAYAGPVRDSVMPLGREEVDGGNPVVGR
ncbi:hypothetical protein SAMN04487783_1078 [Agrococcus baldri]|uniref:Uncharacterized protein n=1 Tax=Agrococcus baldri TaxID=153730 RepID=A0AA94KZ99_9MICO|nr:hypothetical protein SAMN04487783_1078 [Agrococcus baldri]